MCVAVDSRLRVLLAFACVLVETSARVPCLRITRRQKTEYHVSYGGIPGLLSSLCGTPHKSGREKPGLSIPDDDVERRNPRVVPPATGPANESVNQPVDKFLFALFHRKTCCSTLKALGETLLLPPQSASFFSFAFVHGDESPTTVKTSHGARCCFI